MKRYLVFLTLCFSFILANAQNAEHYKVKNFDAAIFPKEYERILYIDTSIKERFTPNAEQVLFARKALVDSAINMRKYYHRNEEIRLLFKNIKKYKWQFWGYIDNKGNHLLSIGCFIPEDFNSITDDRKPPFDSWFKDEVMIEDGGCTYWQAMYNLDTKRIIYFKCNGSA